MNPRAVLFDLDETLYRERRFALSAYAAVARVLEARTGVPASQVFQQLAHSLRRGQRARAFQHLCAAHGWPESWIPVLVETVRTHTPRLRLPAQSRAALAEMRGRWRTAIVTNGLPSVQRRKVRALGLERFVDTVVYAEEHGTGNGKPDPAPFLAAAAALAIDPAQCVFVGDDPVRDVGGAARLGMATILVTHRPQAPLIAVEPSAVTRGLADVPRLASQLAADHLVREGRAECA